METYCQHCNKEYNTSKGLRDHRYNERKAGRHEGHEIKGGYSTKGSKAGSQPGTKDTKMKDVEFAVPMNTTSRPKQEQLINTNIDAQLRF
jgi:hypothetical protein